VPEKKNTNVANINQASEVTFLAKWSL